MFLRSEWMASMLKSAGWTCGCRSGGTEWMASMFSSRDGGVVVVGNSGVGSYAQIQMASI
jgi:hypothetical protein